jgi:hypothetical protein
MRRRKKNRGCRVVVQLVECEKEWEEGRGLLMAKDTEWWFTLRLQEGMRRKKRIVDGRGCRVVVQLVDYEKEWEEGRRLEDAEWWFSLWNVRRNEKKEEDCWWQRIQSDGSL